MLIHIGYHKTASTFLQLRVFDSPASGFRLFPVRDVLPLLVAPDRLGFDTGAVRATLTPWRQEAEQAGKVPVLSHERLSGYPASGGFDGAELADRLHATCPGASVLIVVREQDSMLRSFYKQYVRDGGPLSLRRFLTQRPDPVAARRVPGFSLDVFRYERLVRHYHDRFGAERVLVLPFEQFQRAPVAFLEAIQRFAGIAPTVATLGEADLREVNPRMPNAAITLQRWVNGALRQNDLNPRPWLWPVRPLRHGGPRYRAVMTAVTPVWWDRRAERRQAATIRAVVGDHYAAANQVLADLTGLDLRSYGYRLP